MYKLQMQQYTTKIILSLTDLENEKAWTSEG